MYPMVLQRKGRNLVGLKQKSQTLLSVIYYGTERKSFGMNSYFRVW